MRCSLIFWGGMARFVGGDLLVRWRFWDLGKDVVPARASGRGLIRVCELVFAAGGPSTPFVFCAVINSSARRERERGEEEDQGLFKANR